MYVIPYFLRKASDITVSEKGLHASSFHVINQSPLKLHSRTFHRSILGMVVGNHSCCRKNLGIYELSFALLFSFWLKPRSTHNLHSYINTSYCHLISESFNCGAVLY